MLLRSEEEELAEEETWETSSEEAWEESSGSDSVASGMPRSPHFAERKRGDYPPPPPDILDYEI